MIGLVVLAALLLLMLVAFFWLLAVDRHALLPVLRTCALVIALGGFVAALLH